MISSFHSMHVAWMAVAVVPWSATLLISSKEAISAGGVSGGHRRHVRHLGRLDALQEHPVLRRRGEPMAVGSEDVATASLQQAAVAVAEWRRRRAGVLLLLPAEQLLLERRSRVVAVAPVDLVVEGHDRRGRREAVVGGEVDDRYAGRCPDPERAGGGRGDARELLHYGAEVAGVRVEQRHGRAPRRTGPPPRRRRLPDPGPLHPVQQLLLATRLGGAPAAGPARRGARHGRGSGGADPDAEDVRRGVVGQDRAGGVVVVVVERGPLREARPGVAHRHGRAQMGAEQPSVSAARGVCVGRGVGHGRGARPFIVTRPAVHQTLPSVGSTCSSSQRPRFANVSGSLRWSSAPLAHHPRSVADPRNCAAAARGWQPARARLLPAATSLQHGEAS